jgi:trans-aconitate 2-methyltransferase
MTKTNYTFGDSDEAGLRLRNLANLYEPDTRSLLKRSELDRPRLAIDLGCGPGWSTGLIREILNPEQTVGFDSSMRYLAEARENHGRLIEFKHHDVTQTPFPTLAPDLMFCRFLLTHLQSLEKVLAGWKQIAQPGAFLLIHETESLESENPSLIRYYELVGQLQEHYGQKLQVGAVLESCAKQAGWRVIDSSAPVLEKPAQLMAGLRDHVCREEEVLHEDPGPRRRRGEPEQRLRALERLGEDGRLLEGALDDARAATEKLVDLLLVAAQNRDALAGVEEPRRERAADVGRGRVDDDGYPVTRQHKHVPFMMRVRQRWHLNHSNCSGS